MQIRGRVHNGVVVLEGSESLPEGTIVTVSYTNSPPTISPKSGHRVQFPLVRSDRPGSLDLTADCIAELWDDVSACQWKTEDGRPKREASSSPPAVQSGIQSPSSWAAPDISSHWSFIRDNPRNPWLISSIASHPRPQSSQLTITTSWASCGSIGFPTASIAEAQRALEGINRT
jgi:hypothetical protein